MSKAALYKKIVAVMQEVGQLQKDGDINDKNGKKMYSYLSEEQTTGSLQRAFITHGLVMFPTNIESEIVVLESFAYDKKTITPITKVIVTYKICDSETGESEEIQAIGYGSDSQDKGSNKAMTGAFKYAQRQTFMISTGDDGDHISSAKLDEERRQKAEKAKAKATEEPQQDIPPASLKAKYKLGTGSMDGFEVWVKGQQDKGRNYRDMEQLLQERLTKKQESAGA